MIIEVQIKKDEKIVKRLVEVSKPSILSILKMSVVRQIISQIGEDFMDDIDGYVVSITDKD